MYSLDEHAKKRVRILELLEHYPLNLERIPRFEALDEMSESAVRYQAGEGEKTQAGFDVKDSKETIDENRKQEDRKKGVSDSSPGEGVKAEKGRWSAKSMDVAFGAPRYRQPHETWHDLLHTLMEGELHEDFPSIYDILQLEHSKVHESLQRMKVEVQLVQLLLLQLSNEDVHFVELRYFQKKPISRVCDEMYFSRSTFYRRNEQILLALVGFYDFIFSNEARSGNREDANR